MATNHDRAVDLDRRMSENGNWNLVTARYLGPTNYRGSRIKLYSERFHDSVTLSYDYELGNVYRQAALYLEDHGFAPRCVMETRSGYAIPCGTFKGLKESN